jgi:hypothetical protein
VSDVQELRKTSVKASVEDIVGDSAKLDRVATKGSGLITLIQMVLDDRKVPMHL